MTTTDTKPVTLHIETVAVGNDKIDTLGMDLWAVAAICYEDGPHLGVHYIYPFYGADDTFADGYVRDMIRESGFNYAIA